MSALLSRLSCRQIVRVGLVFCALALDATPVLAQNFNPPPPPSDYTPVEVKGCERASQEVSLDLSTATPGANWIVTGPGPSGPLTPTPATLSAWTALPSIWVQPFTPTQPAVAQASEGTYTYTTWFNLPCPPESYSNLRVAGTFAADNNGTIYLNNFAVASCANSYCFQAPTAFTASTPFLPGLNSLSVVVYNFGGPTGASVSATLSGTCVGSKCERGGLLKICKVAGLGVATGTSFSFTAGSSTFTVPAGPAPGGTCVLGPSFLVGTQVTVKEAIPAGDIVSSIIVEPPGRLVGTNLAGGSVDVKIDLGVTEVTFTDKMKGFAEKTGYLEVCKNGGVTGDFAFKVSPGGLGLYVVPAGACSPAIEVPAGWVTIEEAPTTGTAMLGCATIPASQQGPCDPLVNRTSTVHVIPGNVSTKTIAFISNRRTDITGHGGGGHGGLPGGGTPVDTADTPGRPKQQSAPPK